MKKFGYRTTERIVKEDVLISTQCFCDVCAKEIRGSFWHISHPFSATDTEKEGDTTYDICSKTCMVKFIEEKM